MPKIGSQTIEATLQRSDFPAPVLRFHYLSSAFADTLRHGLVSGQPDAQWKHNARLQLNFIRKVSSSIRWRQRLCRCGFRIPKVEIITGVRDLLSLMLASIFENYTYFASDITTMTVEKCRQALLHPKTFRTTKDWFDLELKAFTGIDVFQTRFPFEKNHAIYENRFARVLVYRYESLTALPTLLSRFLNWNIPELVNCNVSDSKEYSDQYRLVKGELSLPPAFVKSVCNFKLMRHFYSASEREQLQARRASLAETAPIAAQAG